MGDSVVKIRRYKRTILEELFNECTDLQKAIFLNMYGKIEELEDIQLDSAILRCEELVDRNGIRKSLNSKALPVKPTSE